MNKSVNSKNSIIELMRFVFATSVILYHAQRDFFKDPIVLHTGNNINIEFFSRGYIGVEFFFIVTGFLLGKHIFKLVSSEDSMPTEHSLADETLRFVWNKLKQVLPYYLSACFAYIVVNIVTNKNYSFWSFLYSLPSIFFLDMTGLSEERVLSVSWFLSSMFIALMLLYPIIRRHYYMFTTVFAPVLGLIAIGGILKTSSGLGGATAFWGVVYKANIRAIAEIALGTTCFEISRRITGKEFTIRGKSYLSFIACFGYGFGIIYACSNIDRYYDGLVFALLCVSVTITFSQVDLFSQFGLLTNNKIFNFLGAISLPMYVFQNIFRKIIRVKYRSLSKRKSIFLIYALTTILAIIFFIVVNLHKRQVTPERVNTNAI